MGGSWGGHFMTWQAAKEGGPCWQLILRISNQQGTEVILALAQRGGPVFCPKSPTVSYGTSAPIATGTARDKFPIHSLVLPGKDLYWAAILIN